MIFNIEKFIARHITKRRKSLFEDDIQAHKKELKHRIAGKSILVIGGAGTIGSSFVKSILRFKPGRLYVVDINENGLTELTRDLRSSADIKVPKVYKTYPINFSGKVFEKILKNEGPFEIVANFAAHKHVRSEKDHYSIEAMINNNVLEAKKLLDLLVAHRPERFFCVSTDKAANPVNIMGASKKLMEEVIMAYSGRIPVVTARFANVAFSNGSLLFGFIQRLMKGQPLSAPSDVRRYFVSPEESGQICMLACVLGQSGDIFFPKLKENQMMTFSDIAVKFLDAHGLKPDLCKTEKEAKEKSARRTGRSKKYPVYFFKSDTSGEKAFEEFYTGEEKVDFEKFKSLGIIKNAPKPDMKYIDRMFRKLNRLFRKDDISKTDIVEELKNILPNFQHIETGKSLDQKM